MVNFKPLVYGNKDKGDHTGTAANSDIHTRLSEYGLRRIEITKDGNCFFMSIATILSKSHDSGQHICSEIGASSQDTFTLSVHKLLSDRYDYRAFLVDEDQTKWEDEVKKFESIGHFDSFLGDLMPYAMSNVLHISIVIIPVDAAIPCDKVPTKENQYSTVMEPSSSCSCGVNSLATGRKSCIPQPLYASRCGCYKSSSPCGLACQCKNCANPHGLRPVKGDKKQTRRPHTMQLQLPSSKRFAEGRNESIPSSIWSDFEIIVLSVVSDEVKSITGEISKVVKFYNDIVYYSTALFCQKPLPHDIVFRKKTDIQVQAKLQFMKKRLLSLV